MCCLDSDQPFSGITGVPGSLFARGAFCTPVAAATSVTAPSEEGFLLVSSRFLGCSLNRPSEGKLGVLTTFLKLLTSALLICRSALTCYLCKRTVPAVCPARASEGPPPAGRSELRAAAFLSPSAWFPWLAGQVGSAGLRRRWEPGRAAFGQEGGRCSWRSLGAQPFCPPAALWVHRLATQLLVDWSFLVSEGPCCRQAFTSFSPWTGHARRL